MSSKSTGPLLPARSKLTSIPEDDFSLWRWTRDCFKRAKPLGLRLLATFILTTVAIETFLFISSSGYYLYLNRTIKMMVQESPSPSSSHENMTSPTAKVPPKQNATDYADELWTNFTNYLEDFCRRKPVVMDTYLPPCPCISPLLSKYMCFSLKNISNVYAVYANFA